MVRPSEDLIMLIGLLILVLLLVLSGAYARDLDGKWAQSDTPLSRWYRSQTSPQGFACCNEADAVTVDEDIRDGRYWARWDASGGWQQVPEEAVLTTPNLSGAPVVWWVMIDGQLKIRCYSPGPKL